MANTKVIILALLNLWGFKIPKTSAEDIECFVDGECIGSLFIGQWPALDAQECLEICQDHPGCQFFTHYGQEDVCVGLANCVELDNKNCDECYSGNSTCPDLQCWVPGSCVGSTISVDFVSNEENCLDLCQADDSCKWLTFDEFDGSCIQLTECSALGMGDCDTCWSSQVQCGERKDMTKVLVIGGYSDFNESYLDSVEAVELASETSSCDSVANYPFPVHNPAGTLLDGVPIVCGGLNANADINTNECYQYIFDENRWVLTDYSMIQGRRSHGSSMVDSATWLMTGGLDINNNPLDSTEVWHNELFQFGPSLPYPLRGHCQVTLNSSYVAILGGYNGTNYLNYFYLLDWKNAVWISMPDVPVNLENDPCGLIENSVNGYELVVLPDYNSCYIFSFEDMTWREGPTIPYDVLISSEVISVQMEKSFYIMGGYTTEDTVTDAIFQFDNENYIWNLASQELQTARRNGAAIAVPDELVNCG